MGASALHPSEGARFLFERQRADGSGAGGAETEDATGAARYRASIYTPSERFDYEAALALDGSAELTPVAGDDGERSGERRELEDKLLVIARLIARGAAGRRRDGLPPWPQRVLRWRGPGR